MLLTSVVVFVYYTVWTLLTVSHDRIVDPKQALWLARAERDNFYSPSCHRRRPFMTCSRLENGQCEYQQWYCWQV